MILLFQEQFAKISSYVFVAKHGVRVSNYELKFTYSTDQNIISYKKKAEN
jgi:hypothetical protein